MTSAELKRSALGLPAEERQELAASLWKSLEDDAEWMPEWQRQLVDKRLEESAEDPGQDWSTVKAEILPQAS